MATLLTGAVERLRDFERRVAAIHGTKAQSGSGVQTMDTQTEELRAMFAAFLGEGYDPQRIAYVEKLQSQLRSAQAELVRRLDSGRIEPSEYVVQFNELLAACFGEVEGALGHDDFVALFGGPREEQGGFIDTQTFLSSYRRPQLLAR